MFTASVPDMTVIAILATPLAITLWTDLRARLVYPLVLLPGLVAALAIAAMGPLGWPAALIGGGGAAGVTALLVILSRWRWPGVEAPLGSGDVLIAALIGAMFGPQQAPAVLFMGMIAGAVAAGVLLLTRRAQRDAVIPYGVFLCGAALVALVV
jgi:leader peptidase (prepilin peptidase) / N-methyltransferase